MKNKGFTLIELLAVIVILAIIALIATPIILGIINNAREQAKVRTAELIAKETELAYTSYLFKNNGEGDADSFCDYMTEEFFTMDNGEIVTSGENYVACNSSSKLTKVKSGNDYYDAVFYDGTVEIYYNDDMLASIMLRKGTPKICDYANEGPVGDIGGKYICDLDQKRTFYILEVKENDVILLIDKNFTDDIIAPKLAWCTDGKYNLPCENIKDTSISYITEVFDTPGVTVGIPNSEQITSLDEQNYLKHNRVTLEWLYNNAAEGQSSAGYWTSSNCISVASDGSVGKLTCNVNYMMGVRPVITVSKYSLN